MCHKNNEQLSEEQIIQRLYKINQDLHNEWKLGHSLNTLLEQHQYYSKLLEGLK